MNTVPRTTNHHHTLLRSCLICILVLAQGISPLSAMDQFLDACCKIAEARDKKLAVAAEQVNLAKVRTTRSARAFFPSVTAQRRYTKGRTLADVGSEIENSYESEELGIKASQTLFEGGRTRALYRYDALMLAASRYNYTKSREELFYKIKLAYYEMLSLRMEYTALEKAFQEIDKLQKKVRIEYNAKAISELEFLEAENFRDKVENLLKNAECNLALAHKKLTTLVNVESLDDIPIVAPEGLADDVPEISFTLKDCLGFISINNLDLKISQIQAEMANERKKVNRSKVIPKFYVDGYYGQSGEAYVTTPLDLATVWSIMGKMSWSFWGNTFEMARTKEHTNPTNIVDTSSKVDADTLDFRFSLFDDMSYFVDTKEGKVNYQQATADHRDTLNKNLLDLEKAYNEYDNSLRSARTLKNEIAIKKRKLDLLRKRNDLYEVPTVQLMEESWKYADTISSYARAITTNYSSVTEMERLTLMSLR